MYYDLEAIKRFVDTISENGNGAGVPTAGGLTTFTITIGGQPIEPDERRKNTLKGVQIKDILAAHRALAALLYAGVDLKKELGLKRKTGPKTKRKFDMTIHSYEFMVLCSLEGGAIKYHEAVEILMDYWNVGETTAEEFISERRSAAKNFIVGCMRLHQTPDFKPFLNMEALKASLQNNMRK